MIKLPARFIASRLSRRFTVLFVLAALAPLVVIAALTLTYVRATLLDQGQQRIARYAKGYGMEVLSRLLEAAEFAAVAGTTGIVPTTSGGSAATLFPTVLPFSAIEVVPAWSEAIVRNGPFADVRLSEAHRTRLARGQRVLVVVPIDARASTVVMVVPVGPPNRVSWIYAALSQAYLWGSSETWPRATTFCILASDASSSVHCVEELPAAALQPSSSDRVDAGWRSIAWERDGERLQSAVWPQFLDAEFGASDWLVAATQAEAEMLRPAIAFGQVFVPVLLLTLLVVIWTSMRLIRSTLNPLAQLTRATRLVAEKRFDVCLDATRADEFGILAEAFNSMSAHLGRQFQSLSALAEIDREILSSRDLDRVSIAALRHIQQLVPARMVGVMLLDRPDEANARVWFTRGGGTVATVPTLVTADDIDLLRGNGGSGGFPATTPMPDCLTVTGLPFGQPVLICPIVWREVLCGCLVLVLDNPDVLPEDGKSQLCEAAARLAVAVSSAWRDTQLYHQAHHDALTGLPNRPLFFDRLSREIARCARDGTHFALLFLDLDHFKKVNDTQGHFRGDEVLCDAARRLLACVRAADTVARFGGDEFAITIAHGSSRRELSRVVQQVLGSLAEPFGPDGIRSYLGASLGIAIYPTDGRSAEELLQNADTAMYQAKANGRGQAVYYQEAMNREARERVTLEQELHAAITHDQFFLTFQPQVELQENTVIGAEALIRWRHPTRGLVSPGEFIPVAEESSLIETIGIWAIRQACAQMTRMRRLGVAIDRIAVNVSVRQLHDPRFVDIVADALTQSGCAPGSLELEITESVLADRRSAVQDVLNRVAALGVVLALDDFGTGYASLAYLRDLPVSIVKIDRTFVQGLPSSEESLAIVRATIAMAHALKKKVVAEGVETQAQLAMLRDLGCDVVQGYLIAKPLPVTQFESFLGLALHSNCVGQIEERVAA